MALKQSSMGGQVANQHEVGLNSFEMKWKTKLDPAKDWWEWKSCEQSFQNKTKIPQKRKGMGYFNSSAE